MTEIVNYGTLKSAIIEYSHRGDLSEFLDLFIKSTESRINRMLRDRRMLVRSVTTIYDSIVSLPSDFIELRHIQIGDRIPLAQKSQSQQDIDRHSKEISYSIFGNTLEIRPTVVNDVDLEIIYYAKVTPLVNDIDTNIVIDNNPMIYLYGSMIDVCLFTQDDSRVKIWEEAFKSEVALINEDSNQSIYSGSPLTVRGS